MLSTPLVIAIVDDDRSFLDSMRRMLRSLGYDVAAFSSAAELLASPKLPASACLVADVHMPAMSGVDLYRHLTQIGLTIPTILVTAYRDDNVRKRMLEEGVVCHLYKPLQETDLIACLQSALAHSKSPPGTHN